MRRAWREPQHVVRDEEKGGIGMSKRSESIERRMRETREMMATPLDEVLRDVRCRLVTGDDGETWVVARYGRWTARARVRGDSDYWRESARERATELLVVRLAEAVASFMRRCERPRLELLRHRQR